MGETSAHELALAESRAFCTWSLVYPATASIQVLIRNPLRCAGFVLMANTFRSTNQKNTPHTNPKKSALVSMLSANRGSLIRNKSLETVSVHPTFPFEGFRCRKNESLFKAHYFEEKGEWGGLWE